jgi:hypothetical protein
MKIDLIFRLLIISLTTAVFCPAATLAEEATPLCPAQIETVQSIAAPVEGYETVDTKAQHFWDQITFFDGRPEEMASLKYDTEVQKPDRGAVLTWNLDRNAEYWIECRYNATSIALWKKLPPVGRCVVTYVQDLPETVVCQ